MRFIWVAYSRSKIVFHFDNRYQVSINFHEGIYYPYSINYDDHTYTWKHKKAELEPMQIIGKEELFFLRQGNLNVLTFLYAHILLPIKTFHGFFYTKAPKYFIF